jgi:hypothetical protein
MRAAVALLLAALTGCGAGEPRVTVTGRVTAGGKPLTFGPEGRVEVYFTPVDAPPGDLATTSVTATADADGRYRLAGPEGKGVRPGRYRVRVRLFDPYPLRDRLARRFPEPSPLVCEAVADRTFDVEIDDLPPPAR